ncbi:protein S100-P-like [Archocentrus centrarchus]|uniref:protein S100-P-like n=1 Tax=Archocentrus centrarchus TaxID=63155 RepID=UPI0011E9E343|nr:protein S100-P-like [Archocentrus centrarchus]
MTQLETSMACLMKIFDTYAGKEGKPDTLTNAEVKTLLEKELPGLLKGAKSQEDVNKLLKDLDFNGDGEVDFTEFMVLVTSITCICHARPTKK